MITWLAPSPQLVRNPASTRRIWFMTSSVHHDENLAVAVPGRTVESKARGSVQSWLKRSAVSQEEVRKCERVFLEELVRQGMMEVIRDQHSE